MSKKCTVRDGWKKVGKACVVSGVPAAFLAAPTGQSIPVGTAACAGSALGAAIEHAIDCSSSSEESSSSSNKPSSGIPCSIL